MTEFSTERTKTFNTNVTTTTLYGSGTHGKITIDQESEHLIVSANINTYDNPPRSAVREAIHNAFDAVSHRRNQTGEEDLWVTVTTCDAGSDVWDSSKLNTVIIEDDGCGMSRDDLINVYTKMGASTKRDDMSAVGARGAGAKAPLSFLPSFTVESVCDGKLNVIILSVDSHSYSYVLMDEMETDRKNGTKVILATSNRDHFNEMRDCALSFNKTLNKNVKYRIDGVTPTGFSNNDIFVENEFYSIAFCRSCDDFNIASLVLSDGCNSLAKSVSVSMMGYRYYGHDSMFVVSLTPGVLDFVLSRDSIIYNDRYDALMKSVLEDVSRFINERANKGLMDAISSAQTGNMNLINLLLKSKCSLNGNVLTLSGKDQISLKVDSEHLRIVRFCVSLVKEWENYAFGVISNGRRKVVSYEVNRQELMHENICFIFGASVKSIKDLTLREFREYLTKGQELNSELLHGVFYAIPSEESDDIKKMLKSILKSDRVKFTTSKKIREASKTHKENKKPIFSRVLTNDHKEITDEEWDSNIFYVYRKSERKNIRSYEILRAIESTRLDSSQLTIAIIPSNATKKEIISIFERIKGRCARGITIRDERFAPDFSIEDHLLTADDTINVPIIEATMPEQVKKINRFSEIKGISIDILGLVDFIQFMPERDTPLIQRIKEINAVGQPNQYYSPYYLSVSRKIKDVKSALEFLPEDQRDHLLRQVVSGFIQEIETKLAA